MQDPPIFTFGNIECAEHVPDCRSGEQRGRDLESDESLDRVLRARLAIRPLPEEASDRLVIPLDGKRTLSIAVFAGRIEIAYHGDEREAGRTLRIGRSTSEPSLPLASAQPGANTDDSDRAPTPVDPPISEEQRVAVRAALKEISDLRFGYQWMKRLGFISS